MINTEIKDKVLKALCENCQPERMSKQLDKWLLAETGYDFETIDAVLKYFERKGLISDSNVRRVAISLCVRIDAIDFFNHGGFFAQEELLEQNIKKLLLEIESLKPSMPNKVQTITSIASGIATALGFISKI